MLTGKRALITGSTSGIGYAMARALAENGCDVILNGLGAPDEIETRRAALAEATGRKVLFHGADLLDVSAIEALIAYGDDALGGVDILVNNAGMQFTASTEIFPPAKWEAIIALNLSAAFHCSRLALPGMKARNWGRIINTASVHGLVASVNKAAYVAAKHGLVGLTKVMGLETAESGITVNAVCPGWVRTELIERQIAERAAAQGISIDEGARDLVAEKQPSKTFVTPEQLGALAVFLCSDAAAQITGTALPVDGGWTAQ